MKILFLAHRLPYPPNKGDKIRSWHLLKWLAARHEVWVASLVDDADDLRHLQALRAQVRDLATDRIDRRSRAVTALRSLASGEAVSVRWFHTPVLQAQVDEWIGRHGFDAYFCYSSPTAEYLYRSRYAAGIARRPRVMDFIDVDSYKWRQYADRARGPMRAVYAREGRLLGDYERRVAREFDASLVVSEQERAFFADPEAVRYVAAVSNGVDLDYFAPRPQTRVNPGRVVFTGVMDYWPNVEGVLWFVERAWARIRAAVPGAEFYVVGSRPSPAVQALAREPGVTVTGFVEDVREFIAGAALCVAPLTIARGIQNKVLEAMAMGRPVLATPEAFEGVAAAAGQDLVVAGGPEAYANAAIALLQDPERAAALGANARRRVEERYSWERNLAPLARWFPGTA